MVPGLPVAPRAVDGAVDELHTVVLVQAEVIAWVSDLASPDQLVVGQPLCDVVQVPLEALAVHFVADGLALRDLPVVTKALLQGKLEFTQSGRKRRDT